MTDITAKVVTYEASVEGKLSSHGLREVSVAATFALVHTVSFGVDRIQRNFEPIQRQVESGRQTQTTDSRAKLIFCPTFVEGKLYAPKRLLPNDSGWLPAHGVRIVSGNEARL